MSSNTNARFQRIAGVPGAGVNTASPREIANWPSLPPQLESCAAKPSSNRTLPAPQSVGAAVIPPVTSPAGAAGGVTVGAAAAGCAGAATSVTLKSEMVHVSTAAGAEEATS